MKKLTIWIVCLVLFSMLYGKGDVSYVYAPTISLNIDRLNEKVIEPIQETTVELKKIYASTWIKNIAPNTTVKFVWYRYGKNGKKQILALTKGRVKDTGFVYASLSQKSGKRFPAGEYFVDIMLNKEVAKTASFEVYKNIGNSISEWKKLKEKAFELDRVGKHSQAVKLLEKSIAVAKKESPVNYKHIVMSLLNLAIMHGDWGEDKKEEYYYRKAVKISQNHRGMGNMEAAVALRGMAVVYRKEGEYKKAIKYCKESLKIFKRVLSKYDEDFIDTQDILANIYLKINQVKKAESISQKSIKTITNQKHYGRYSKIIVNPLSTLAHIYFNRKQYRKAEYYIQWALKITQKHPEVDKAIKSYLLFRLSRLYMQTKEYKKAEPYIKQYINYSKELYGQNHKRTIDALNGLMVVYAKTDRIDKARELYKEIQKLSKNPIALKSVAPNSHMQPCSNFEQDNKLVANVRNKYAEVTLRQIKSLKINRFHTPNYTITLLAPMGWHNATNKGDDILYLLRKDEKSVGKFLLYSLKKFQNSTQAKTPDELIKKAAKFYNEISLDIASKNGDKAKQISSVKFFNFNNKRIGHFVIQRRGKTKNRWESYTFIWDGKKLYMIFVTSRENELEVGEFLSLLAAKSFCSEGR